MDMIQIAVIGIVATILIAVIKVHRPEIAIQISIITGIIIFLLILSKISSVIQLLSQYAEKADIDISYIKTLFKIIGIAYITEFGAEICKDAGENSIASKVELAGKVTIILLAVPIITSLLDLVINIMP